MLIESLKVVFCIALIFMMLAIIISIIVDLFKCIQERKSIRLQIESLVKSDIGECHFILRDICYVEQIISEYAMKGYRLNIRFDGVIITVYKIKDE